MKHPPLFGRTKERDRLLALIARHEPIHLRAAERILNWPQTAVFRSTLPMVQAGLLTKSDTGGSRGIVHLSVDPRFVAAKQARDLFSALVDETFDVPPNELRTGKMRPAESDLNELRAMFGGRSAGTLALAVIARTDGWISLQEIIAALLGARYGAEHVVVSRNGIEQAIHSMAKSGMIEEIRSGRDKGVRLAADLAYAEQLRAFCEATASLVIPTPTAAKPSAFQAPDVHDDEDEEDPTIDASDRFGAARLPSHVSATARRTLISALDEFARNNRSRKPVQSAEAERLRQAVLAEPQAQKTGFAAGESRDVPGRTIALHLEGHGCRIVRVARFSRELTWGGGEGYVFDAERHQTYYVGRNAPPPDETDCDCTNEGVLVDPRVLTPVDVPYMHLDDDDLVCLPQHAPRRPGGWDPLRETMHSRGGTPAIRAAQYVFSGERGCDARAIVRAIGTTPAAILLGLHVDELAERRREQRDESARTWTSVTDAAADCRANIFLAVRAVECLHPPGSNMTAGYLRECGVSALQSRFNGIGRFLDIFGPLHEEAWPFARKFTDPYLPREAREALG